MTERERKQVIFFSSSKPINLMMPCFIQSLFSPLFLSMSFSWWLSIDINNLINFLEHFHYHRLSVFLLDGQGMKSCIVILGVLQYNGFYFGYFYAIIGIIIPAQI